MRNRISFNTAFEETNIVTLGQTISYSQNNDQATQGYLEYIPTPVNISQDQDNEDFPTKQFTHIVAIADNNCGYNAFGMWFVDAIQRNVKFDENILAELVYKITKPENIALLESRVASYSDANFRTSYAVIIEPLKQFIAMIQKSDLSTFLVYIKKQTSRIGVAALSLGLAPALREIAVDHFEKKFGAQEQLVDYRKDGQHADAGALTALGDAFNANVHYHTAQGKAPTNPQYEQNLHLLHSGTTVGHWDLLIPANQQNGLVAYLEPSPVFNEKAEPVIQASSTTKQIKAVTTCMENIEQVTSETFGIAQEHFNAALDDIDENVKKFETIEVDVINKAANSTTAFIQRVCKNENVAAELSKENPFDDLYISHLLVKDNLKPLEAPPQFIDGMSDEAAEIILNQQQHHRDLNLARLFQNYELVTFFGHHAFNNKIDATKKLDSSTKPTHSNVR